MSANWPTPSPRRWRDADRPGTPVVDIRFGHVLYRYFDIAIVRRDRPVLQRYYDTLTARPAGRPAYREREMVSYDKLRVAD